jgi:DNA adenine methylase
MVKTKPFLKWAGSKFRCIDTILTVLPNATRLVEPFAGSGAIFINSNYQEYILAERNQDLISLFQYVQQEGLEFINYCAKLFSPMTNCKEHYYMLRQEFNQCIPSPRRAALFLYLNRHGYNGLCRYNSGGIYNVPFGRYLKPYFPRLELLFFYQKSQNVCFITNDFRETFALAKPGDIIYCDPPYVPLSSTANFLSYTDKKFNESDQIALAKLAQISSQNGITVVISNHDTEFTRFHYQAGRIISFPVRRYISCHSHARHIVQELVAIFEAT